ncbi:MAG: hypothetical protein JEY94_11070 [Melioribacteraceae bacterium]|nr:hypothetical protein [Melioribacteraceae bacterium]
MKNTIYVGDSILKKNNKRVDGEIVEIEKEKYYKISNYDSIDPFLMNIVSDSDLWMFLSSNGALTCGRQNSDSSLFPYYTDDRIHDSQDITGSKTILFLTINEKTYLWEPFSSNKKGLYNIERNIYKNIVGNKVIFQEINHDLRTTFSYSWMNCDKFGFIKKSSLDNDNDNNIKINVLDGIQNILPYGIDKAFQLEYSTLLDGYKKNELLRDSNLGLYTLSSIPTDRAEPNESLKATSVWFTGLDDTAILLTSKQLESFIENQFVNTEIESKAERGSYFVNSLFTLDSKQSKVWNIISDLNKDQSSVAELDLFIKDNDNLLSLVENEISIGTEKLNSMIANSDGFQITSDELNSFRHYSNTLFNIMRGGIFDDNYKFNKKDFQLFINRANKIISSKYSDYIFNLPEDLNLIDLKSEIEKLNDLRFEKLFNEYLPLTFSRRHGDPSRPWNRFSIDIKDYNGDKVLNYEGNWRDIFQNWEALAHSFPSYIKNMITRFLNGSTADGYNPYRVLRDGFDWEVLDPDDAWAYIGYWGDHQIIYLLKLLEFSKKYHPCELEELVSKNIFAYTNVPYRIKKYNEIVENPRDTVTFDYELEKKIYNKVDELGTDGKFIFGNNDEIYQVNLTEKLLVTSLTKISNFIPEAGIWMNTQRPEWNDANNALVGFGTSMVTLYYLRQFCEFGINIYQNIETQSIEISKEVSEFFKNIESTLTGFQNLLVGKFSDSDRKNILDGLGNAGSDYRWKIYNDGFSGEKIKIGNNEIVNFYKLVISYLDHSIQANKRNDNLYHSYNLIKIKDDKVSIRYLYEMLEGQVAILSSGYLNANNSLALLKSLRKSSLYRENQNSYILYPDRHLPEFINKNIIPNKLVEKSVVIKNLMKKGDTSIVISDIAGNVHFHSNFRNASILTETLSVLKNINSDEKQEILDLYETVFDHQSFTGRSGTFYKYEGLGSIYWHMVSKLLLAVKDTIYRVSKEDEKEISKLKKFYYDIREGIGVHKKPDEYGAFPTDAYSHTPRNSGVQQPGMTGQVKEDLISRFGELGVVVKDGIIEFNPVLLEETEFLDEAKDYIYFNVKGEKKVLRLEKGMLAFSMCQTPIIYIKSNENKIIVENYNNCEEKISDLKLTSILSKSVFERKDEIEIIRVYISQEN